MMPGQRPGRRATWCKGGKLFRGICRWNWETSGCSLRSRYMVFLALSLTDWGEPPCGSERVSHRRQQSCSSRFKVPGSKPNGLSRLPTEAAKPPFQVPGYVHPGHDFRRDSTKLKETSLCAHCSENSKFKPSSWSNKHESISYLSVLNSQFSTLSSQLSSCPQIFTDFKDFSQAGRLIMHYALCIMNYALWIMNYELWIASALLHS